MNNYVQKLPFSGSNFTFCMQRRCWTLVRCFSVRIDTHEDLLTVSCPSHRRAVPRHITDLPSLLTTKNRMVFNQVLLAERRMMGSQKKRNEER